MRQKLFIFAVTVIALFYSSSVFKKTNAVTPSQPQSFVNFLIPKMNGWYYTGENSTGISYVFQNSTQSTTILLKKDPENCENTQEFNRIIMSYIQALSKTQEYMEQRKTAVPYSFLGQKYGHMIISKSRVTNQRRFLLNYHIGTEMYQIEIAEAQNLSEPSGGAIAFIGQIAKGTGQGTPPVPETVPPLQQQATAQTQSKQAATSEGQGAVSTIRESAATTRNSQTGTANQNQGTTGTAPSSSQSKSGQGFKPPANVSFNPGNIEKGKIPEVKFSATDPCALAANSNGLPWDKATLTKIDLPKDVTAIVPPVLPNLQHLSQFSFNSAVSAAFEAMRLVYGPMPESEAKQFEAAWAPLFDYPTQEIVEYLNKLNPLVSQFLACRESYVRILTDLQIVMFDAAIAIEDDSQYAWEAAMAEAAIYTSILQPLDATMKKLASQIETLGNPPDPNAAKCEARQRYKRTFAEDYPFEGEWVLDDGEEFLLKVGFKYPDGKVLVYWFPISWLNEMEAKGFDISEMGMKNNDKGDLGIIPGMYDLLKVMEEIELGFWVSYHWAMDRTMYVYRPDNDVMKVNKYHPASGWSPEIVLKNNSARKKGEVRNPPPVLPFDDNQKKSWDELVQVLPQDNWSGNKFRNYAALKDNYYLSDLETALYGVQDKNDEYKRKKTEIENNINISAQEKEIALKQLEEEYAETIVKSASGKKVSTPSEPVAQGKKENAPSANEGEEQARKEAIAFHTEMIDVVKHNLERDLAERNEVSKELAKAKNAVEAKRIADRIKEFDMRIIHHQSNMQAEQDLVDSHKTGKLVHTRTVFDDYAHTTFIDNIRENAARMDATRRIAERINRQIELLPWEQRAAAREQADRVLDANTVASGDIEKARKFAQAVTNQVQGHAEYDRAKAKEAEVDSEQNEFYLQMAVVAAGAGAIGFGSAALIQTFGAQSAAAIYGSKALGAIYGGTTGALAGGPKEGVTQAVSYWSPMGYAATQFVDGFQRAGYQKNADKATQLWEGAKQAGTAWVMGKSFELGTGLVVKGSQKFFGGESRLFKPIVNTPSQRSKEILDGIRTQNKTLNASDEVGTFRKLETDLAILKRDPAANAPKIAQMEKELNQLAAGLNMNYYTKWNLKYKADALTRSKYDRRVQQNYAEMAPGMKSRLEQQGYNLNGIEFKQFRNPSSGGTSSMDLDLVPVRIGTKNEPAFAINGKKMVMKKDGSMVSLEQFTDDAQKAMNAEYKRITGLSATASEMNLVTSVHKEAFSTAKLLDHDIDFSTFTSDEVASIGKVLQVKMDGINKNQMLTNTTKMQARCREASKEIENMLLRKLNSDLQKAPAGSSQRKQIEIDIKYWNDMLKRLKTIGTIETNPSEIMKLNREIMRETGGFDTNVVISDLIRQFK